MHIMGWSTFPLKEVFFLTPMGMNSASDACVHWLQNSLHSLKTSLVGQRRSSAELVKPRQRLLAALHGRNLEAAQGICRAYEQGAAGARDSVTDLILPAVYAAEQDWLQGLRSYDETLSVFWCLQQLLEQRKEQPDRKPALRATPVQERTVFAAAPGCEHTLGVLVVSDHFRSWGWQVRTLLEGRRDVLVHEVSTRPIDFLGLSVGHDAGLEGMPELIQELRASSCNPAMKILLGGNIFDMNAVEYAWLGADCLATSPQDALQFCMSNAQHLTH